MGAPLRCLIIACALVFALVPAAVGAKRDLSVSVSRLTVPSRAQNGRTLSVGVRYIVRGPQSRRAIARITLVLRGENRFVFSSNPALVRRGIWTWNAQDTVPALAPGPYIAVATVTLSRSGKRIATATRSKQIQVSNPT